MSYLEHPCFLGGIGGLTLPQVIQSAYFKALLWQGDTLKGVKHCKFVFYFHATPLMRHWALLSLYFQLSYFLKPLYIREIHTHAIAHTHTHTHTYIYIYIYIHICFCVAWNHNKALFVSFTSSNLFSCTEDFATISHQNAPSLFLLFFILFFIMKPNTHTHPQLIKICIQNFCLWKIFAISKYNSALLVPFTIRHSSQLHVFRLLFVFFFSLWNYLSFCKNVKKLIFCGLRIVKFWTRLTSFILIEPKLMPSKWLPGDS